MGCDTGTPDGLLVRRALDADPRTWQRRWTARPFRYADYQDAELGYAVTDHAAQGRTLPTGLAVITGTEDRQHAYVALTAAPTPTSPTYSPPPPHAPTRRPARELARYDKIHAERAGVPAPVTEPAPPGTALGVLPAVLDRTASSTRSPWTGPRRDDLAAAETGDPSLVPGPGACPGPQCRHGSGRSRAKSALGLGDYRLPLSANPRQERSSPCSITVGTMP
jgi:hypothetical protein